MWAAAALLLPLSARADQTCPNPTPVPPQGTCHPSACTPGFCARGDIAPLSVLPALQNRLVTIDCSPHSVAPLQVFAEATPPAGNGLLFQYYLLDSTGFQESVFTTSIPKVNDTAMLTVWGANCNLSTIGAVRLELEPKLGLPTNPNDPGAFIDVFTDIRGLFVINNESGWYEGWMIHDLRVVPVGPKDRQGHAMFGHITAEDARLLAAMGSGNNVPGHYFTVDGHTPRPPQPSDSFPTRVSNLVPIQLSMGAYNALQQSDAHNYWEFNYTTNWIHPLYELPFAGGFPDHRATEPADTYHDGEITKLSSVVPGEEINEVRERREAVIFGDNPDLPRDPDKFDAGDDAQREFRERFIPSAVAREVFLNVYERLASFEPGERNLERRLVDGYKAAIRVADFNHDGIISAAEGDIDTPNPNCSNPAKSECLFLPAPTFNRFAVTREINDGFLAPRFAPSTRGWVLSGNIVTVSPPIPAAEGEDSDDR
jgi:hypothetical protein